MNPTNDHEAIIATAVDTRIRENPDQPFHLIVRDIAMTLEFIMSAADTEFLVHYTRWQDRFANRPLNPISPRDLALQR